MPAWVKDHDLWEEAKKQVDRKKYPKDDQYYAVVTTVYKNMGGKVKKHKSSLLRSALILGDVSEQLRIAGMGKKAANLEEIRASLESDIFAVE